MLKEIKYFEEWKPVEEFEGLYEVSNFGRVRSLNHKRANRYSYYIQKGRILKSGLNKKTGYWTVVLSKNGKYFTKRVHQLVAKAFIPNPNNYPCVNHKDENKNNNKFDNLEWCTYKYNNNFGSRNKRISISLSKKCNCDRK